jgi:hypothetical protein
MKLLHTCQPVIFLIFLLSCNEMPKTVSENEIAEIGLKKGELISCGMDDKKFGTVTFDVSCSDKVKEEFNLAMKLLHSFEYEEAEKLFAKVISMEPGCAMAYWGVAMSNYHPLWTPPTESELKKGSKAIEIAQHIRPGTKREADYINAISIYYKNWNTVDHYTRSVAYEKEMEKIYQRYPDDPEAAIFYALSLDASAKPTDKTYANQKKAGDILAPMYNKYPDHPGIIHYIIHSYDSPELASLALPAARKYASVAPSSAHALHMPSHIFTRLGLWDESISSNMASADAAKCYAEGAGIKGHWDEELHAIDYLMYAYLQKRDDDHARNELNYLQSIKNVEPLNFKVSYAFASVPSRYYLENKKWEEAASLKSHIENFPWKDHPWPEAIIHFTKALGFANLGRINEANSELRRLNELYAVLSEQKDAYKANQVMIQVKAADAWIRLKEGKHADALQLMSSAADMEDKTEKHPVTPAEVLPARELYADMLMEVKQYAKALSEYEADLKKHPNRFNGLKGAALAAERSGDREKADYYSGKLKEINLLLSRR